MDRPDAAADRGTRLRAAQIHVAELRLLARVGVNPGEQGASQAIALDIQVGVEDLERAASSEQLEDTVDYVALARTARAVVERRHYPLVETLALAVGRETLLLPGVTWVRVKLSKLHCLKRAAGAGVTVELEREPRRSPGRSAAQQGSDNSPRQDGAPRALAPSALTGEQEVVIVGGGAAGLAAALWCWRLGHPALLVEPSARLGGQLHMVHGLMTDLPGLQPMDGQALVSILEGQFSRHGGRWLHSRLAGLQEVEEGCLLRLEAPGEGGTRELSVRAVILAMGSMRRELGVPGERELAGKGILFTAARDAELQAGRHVVVVGGGDSACENALILRKAGAGKLTLVHRGDRLTALRQFAEPVMQDPGIQVLEGRQVRRFLGEGRLTGLELTGPRGPEVIAADAALVRIGWQPATGCCPPSWRDEQGFLLLDSGGGRLRGSRRVFAAGEVTGAISSSVASAFGGGATAARAAVMELERGGQFVRKE